MFWRFKTVTDLLLQPVTPPEPICPAAPAGTVSAVFILATTAPGNGQQDVRRRYCSAIKSMASLPDRLRQRRFRAAVGIRTERYREAPHDAISLLIISYARNFTTERLHVRDLRSKPAAVCRRYGANNFRARNVWSERTGSRSYGVGEHRVGLNGQIETVSPGRCTSRIALVRADDCCQLFPGGPNGNCGHAKMPAERSVMFDVFGNLLSNDGFTPHGFCLTWRPDVFWT